MLFSRTRDFFTRLQPKGPRTVRDTSAATDNWHHKRNRTDLAAVHPMQALALVRRQRRDDGGRLRRLGNLGLVRIQALEQCLCASGGQGEG